MEFFASSTFGFLLKLAMALIGGFFGLLGLGTKTRDDAGNLTRHGKIALIGLLSSVVLAVITQVYEFYVSQRKAEADRVLAQAELVRASKLMLSVQRGIYPLRGIRADVEIELPRDNPAFAEARQQIRRGVSTDRECEQQVAGVHCLGRSLADNKIFSFIIDASSSLYPRPDSDALQIIRYLQLFVALYRMRANDVGEPTFQYLGRFWIDWHDGTVLKGVELIYDYPHDALSLRIQKLNVSDNEVAGSGVYSLADITPGAIAAKVMIWDDMLCEQVSDEKCRELLKGYEQTKASDLRLVFSYPKSIWLHRDSERCLAISLPDDVEKIDFLGNVRWSESMSRPTPPCAEDK